jgi:histidinol phosphatase-like enzyme
LSELHHHKSMLEIEQAVTDDLTNAQARARDVVTAINHEGLPRPTFAIASQNVAATTALLDTLLAPSVDEVDKVYR